jgi:succinate-semialdehyde dehydrogenase/glutarate-semialdehyde dehydrogenase
VFWKFKKGMSHRVPIKGIIMQDKNKTEEAKIEVKSPVTGEIIGKVKSFSSAEALAALENARRAQKAWGQTTFALRRKKISALIDQIFENAEDLARLVSSENGQPLLEIYLVEVLFIAHLAAYFSRKAQRILAPRRLSISLFKHRISYLHYKPRGVVLVISPWNLPLAIPFSEVIMALIAGNSVILKPASLTPLIAYKMRELFDRAGIDPDLFQVVSGPGRIASELIETGVDYVNFTGSTEVGRKVAEICGRKLIPCAMELGGKAPLLILADADINKAARGAVWGAFAHSGQYCCSVERVYVHESKYAAFVEKAVEYTRSLRQKDPLSEGDTDIGSMIDPRQLDIVEQQIAAAVKDGARVLCGGKRSQTGNMFFEPTILVDVTDDMDIVKHETFGPVMPIMKFSTESEAVDRANNSPYGLLAYVFTSDVKHGRRIAEQIEAGTVIINEFHLTFVFPEAPWGGIKQSGIGFVRSDDGLRSLCQVRHVNYDILPGVDGWFPYTAKKLERFISLYALVHRQDGIAGKLRTLKSLISGQR